MVMYEKMRLAVKGLLVGMAFLILVGIAPYPCLAKVSTEMKCSVCHTMHNSQGGTSMAYEYSGGSFDPTTTPQANLLVTDCVGCHTAIDGTTWKSSVGAPIVFNTSEPQYGDDAGDGKNAGLAAGNFYWVTQADSKGHNVFLNDSDGELTNAPGTGVNCSMTSCHETLSEPEERSGLGRQGCTCCHMLRNSDCSGELKGYHHADDSNIVVGSELNDTDGYYRFLTGHSFPDFQRGACGIEDPDWNHGASASSHNEYLAHAYSDKAGLNPGFDMQGHTVTALCTGCHGFFMGQATDENPTGAPWLRHPADQVIPSDEEYGSISTTYDPLVPVGRPSLDGWTGPSSTVTPGTDMVMCLSCHRAHASPYSDMLRWEYENLDSAVGNSRCLNCHTEK